MVWLPTAKVEVVRVATPRLRLALPIELPSARKVTLPVGVPAPAPIAVTVAVKLTDWPKTLGLGAEATPAAVKAMLTVCVSVLDVLPLKFTSPP